MNVLLFVMSFLMLFSLLTYGRLESFRHFGCVQMQFEDYMKNRERQYVNEEAIKRYTNTPATRREKTEQDKHENNLASSRLSFRLLIDKTERDANPDKVEPHLNLAKQLIIFLYGDQPFYKELEEERSSFVYDILKAIMRETAKQEKKYTDIGELANINLGDMELNEAFTKMLQGKEKPKRSKRTDEEKRTFQPDDGYYRLQDFITTQPKKLTIRVYLASGQLLMAIYGNHDTVKEILESRNRLYRAVIEKTVTTEEAEKEFRALFLSQRLPIIPESMLNFGVSKTYPKGYE